MIADNIYDAVSKCFVLPFEEKTTPEQDITLKALKETSWKTV